MKQRLHKASWPTTWVVSFDARLRPVGWASASLPGGMPGPGQDPGSGGDSLMGQCTAGLRPYYACAVGSGYVGACSAGTLPDTSVCNAGGFHTYAACDKGASAVTVCLSGQGQNF